MRRSITQFEFFRRIFRANQTPKTTASTPRTATTISETGIEAAVMPELDCIAKTSGQSYSHTTQQLRKSCISMARMAIFPVGSSRWIDIFALIAAVTCLETALTGRLRSRRSFWNVKPSWLRPVFGIIGLALLGFLVPDFLSRVS
jgi:hypothetical protein